MIRVAFTLIGGKDWLGGANYLRNLLRTLANFNSEELQPVLFVDALIPDSEISDLYLIPSLEIIRTSSLSQLKYSAFLQAIIWGRNIQLHDLFKKWNIDVVFESAQFFGWRFGFPVIAWIPDFQHKVLPHLFTTFGWLRREAGFRLQIFSGREIMLSSEDAQICCERYYPTTRGRTNVVHFSILPRRNYLKEWEIKTSNHYNLPANFFFLPNQFWRHKNHGLVLEALDILRQRNIFPVVVSSGRQIDPRNSIYFEGFKQDLLKAQLEEQFILLGLIPYQDLEGLMQQCCALINPSFFEGWSTTVEEARSMGVPMILSDIAVHREQMGDEAIYFQPNSAESLATAIEFFVPLGEEVRLQSSEKGNHEAFNRAKKFSIDFFLLAQKCLLR